MEGLLPDFTFFIQLGIFFACFAVLQLLVFKPYLSLLKAREEKTIGMKEAAARKHQQAEKLRADYDAFMKAERKKLSSWMDEQRRIVADEEKKIIQAARDEVGKELHALRDVIKSDSDRVRADLLPLISDYSSSLASKLIGHQIKVPISAVQREKTAEAEQVV